MISSFSIRLTRLLNSSRGQLETREGRHELYRVSCAYVSPDPEGR